MILLGFSNRLFFALGQKVPIDIRAEALYTLL